MRPNQVSKLTGISIVGEISAANVSNWSETFYVLTVTILILCLYLLRNCLVENNGYLNCRPLNED